MSKFAQCTFCCSIASVGVATTSLVQVAFGPFMGKMFLVVVDAHSKWLEVKMVPAATSKATIVCLQSIFAERVVTNNGSVFTSEEFKAFLEANGIAHSTSSPCHPPSNGLAERAVQSFKQSVRKFTSGSIESKLSRFLFTYRLTPHATTSQSSAELLFKRRPRSRLDILVPSIEQVVERRQDNQKKWHDIHSPTHVFAIGDSVFIKDFRPGSKRWLPGKIVELLGPVSARGKLSNGEFHRHHFDHIRICQVPDQAHSPVMSVDSNTEDWTSSVPIPVDSQSVDSSGTSTLTCPPTSMIQQHPLVQRFVVLHINVQHPIDGTQVSSNYCNLYIGL